MNLIERVAAPAWLVEAKKINQIKAKLYAKSKCCMWCGKKLTFEKATLEHVTPRSKGGRTSVANGGLACSSCNKNRGNLDEDEFRLSDWLRNKRYAVRCDKKKVTFERLRAEEHAVKAADYATQYNDAQDKELALQGVFSGLLVEMKDIVAKRNCKKDSAVRSVINELNQKWKAFCGLTKIDFATGFSDMLKAQDEELWKRWKDIKPPPPAPALQPQRKPEAKKPHNKQKPKPEPAKAG